MDKDGLVSDELMEYAILEKKFLAQYDLEKTEENVLEIMSKFFKAQYKFTGIMPPRMTSNYELRYEGFSNFNYNDSLGNYVETKLDSKQDIINFYNIIAVAISRMNSFERVYYAEFLLNGKSERYTADVIGVSRTVLTQIKNSCILKIALAFGKEVEL